MTVRVAVPDLISPSYFPVIAAVELGFFEREGLDATIESVYPVTATYGQLRDGVVDFVGGSAHTPLYAFPDWQDCRLVCALSQHMYWFLVVRADLAPQRGDLGVVRGLRIGAARGPDAGLRRMLQMAGIDPEHDLTIGPPAATNDSGISFGLVAAQALEEGTIDGFWANGMGAELAIQKGVGALVADARRNDGPAGARDLTFPALAASERRIDEDPDSVAAAARAVVGAQRALAQDPAEATRAAARLFPATERGLIAELVRRDASFYDPAISNEAVASLNDFCYAAGLTSTPDVPYEQVVAAQFAPFWRPQPSR